MMQLRRMTTDLESLRNVLSETLLNEDDCCPDDGLVPSKISDINNEKENRPVHHVEVHAPRQPFLLTRIGSKHRQAIQLSISNKPINAIEKRIAEKMQQLEGTLAGDMFLRQMTEICDDAVADARLVFHDSLATGRIGAGNTQEWRDVAINTNDPTDYVSRQTITRTDSRKTGATQNHLDCSDPVIGRWLRQKEAEDRIRKDAEREEELIRKKLVACAQSTMERRKEESDKAFRAWCANKKHTKRLNDVPKESSASEAESESDLSPAQAGRQPRPRHNYVYRRPKVIVMRPKTVASFNIRTNVRMKVSGHKVDFSTVEAIPQSARQIEYPRPTVQKLSALVTRPQTAVPSIRPRHLPFGTSNERDKFIKKNKRKKQKLPKVLDKEKIQVKDEDATDNFCDEEFSDQSIAYEISVPNIGSDDNNGDNDVANVGGLQD